MDSIKSINNIPSLRRDRNSEGTTQMTPMQPLNEIGSTSFSEELNKELEKLNNDNKPEVNDTSDYEPGYEKVCGDCQIAMITGTCTKCGLYQYGDRFEFLVRRKIVLPDNN